MKDVVMKYLSKTYHYLGRYSCQHIIMRRPYSRELLTRTLTYTFIFSLIIPSVGNTHVRSMSRTNEPESIILTSNNGNSLANGQLTTLTLTGNLPEGTPIKWSIVQGEELVSRLVMGKESDNILRGKARIYFFTQDIGYGKIIVEATPDNMEPKKIELEINANVSELTSNYGPRLTNGQSTLLKLTSNLPNGTPIEWSIVQGEELVSRLIIKEEIGNMFHGEASIYLFTQNTGYGKIIVKATPDNMEPKMIEFEIPKPIELTSSTGNILTHNQHTRLTLANLPECLPVQWSFISGQDLIDRFIVYPPVCNTHVDGSASIDLYTQSYSKGLLIIEAIVDNDKYKKYQIRLEVTPRR